MEKDKTRFYMEIATDRHTALKEWAARERIPMSRLFERIIDNRDSVSAVLRDVPAPLTTDKTSRDGKTRFPIDASE